ncbi:MAG TPA: methyl-accepting chemotaxis protein [Archangium sp.]|jgi:methyl-accepting chemotaxis protein|uniref:methyl-accepting chemotaxis protein n=1 Tax=Archangium sp. TaxID=1872627 RepID=UPI002EDA5E20
MSKGELNRLTLKIFMLQQVGMLSALPPTAYMFALIMGLTGDLAWRVTLINVSIIVPLFGVALPILLIRGITQDALERRPHDRPGERLKRILQISRKIEVGLFIFYAVAAVGYVTWPQMTYGLDPWMIPQVLSAFLLIALIVFIRQSVWIDRLMRPYALEEFHKHPEVQLNYSGLLWPKQRWYLPYCFALFVLSTLTVTGIIIFKKAQVGFAEMFAELSKVVSPETLGYVRESVAGIMSSISFPVILVGGFLVLTAAWTAWELARSQSSGTTAVQQSIESLASGRPTLPNWVATDEVGDLSISTAAAFEQLRAFSLSLGESAKMLGTSAEQLGDSHRVQTQALSVQATSLQETQVTAQEIKQTSMVAAQKAESVLQQADRADQIGRAGEKAIEQSLGGLQEIQQQVLQMAQSIRALDERTQQIANITTTVKDLADRSNMLALNAAIEAVRSGEHGKGFGVVAREIRSLADQSIRATYSVRDVLEQLSTAIRTTADMSEQGSEKVTASLTQVQSFGDNIRQLSGIVRDNASAVRQISAAVTQQNSGIGQIFQAVNDLTRVMDQTMTSLRTSDDAANQMRSVAERVNGFVRQYGWRDAQRVGDSPHITIMSPPEEATVGSESAPEQERVNS